MASAIVETQKNLNNLRKAATQAKTALDEAKRDLKRTQEWLQQDPTRTDLAERIEGYKTAIIKAEEKLATARAAVAAAEAAIPARKVTQFDAVLRWFSGAALRKAKDALDLIEASVAQGEWLTGASRKAWAALKPNVAKKQFGDLGRGYNAPKAESAIHYAVAYGSFNYLAGLSLQDASKNLSNEALEFYIDFRPLVDAMIKLDNTRPRPVFTTMNASPTISAELKRQGAVTVEVCPIEWEKVEDPKTGKIGFRAVLVWPEDTIHGSSRYTQKSMDQCHACGHAIRNPFNWVPLILTDDKGQKKSLWVGRDCSATLFGVKMDGDLELAPNQR